MALEISIAFKLAIAFVLAVGASVSIAASQGLFNSNSETKEENTYSHSEVIQEVQNNTKDTVLETNTSPLVEAEDKVVEQKVEVVDLPTLDSEEEIDGEDEEFVSAERSLKGIERFRIKFIGSNNPNYSVGTIGQVFGRFLIDTKKTKDNDVVSKWWELSYSTYKLDPHLTREEGNPFKDVKEAYSKDNPKALNKVCEGVYKQALNSLVYVHKTDEDDLKNYLRDDLWEYCSKLATPPKVIDEGEDYKSYPESSIGALNKTKLLSVHHEDRVNNYVWKVKQEEFYKLDLSSFKEGSPFRNIRENQEFKKSKHTLRDKCKEFYSLREENLSGKKTSLEEITKYCSFEI